MLTPASSALMLTRLILAGVSMAPGALAIRSGYLAGFWCIGKRGVGLVHFATILPALVLRVWRDALPFGSRLNVARGARLNIYDATTN